MNSVTNSLIVYNSSQALELIKSISANEFIREELFLYSLKY